MSSYTIAASDIGKYEIALVANTEDTVTFGGGAADRTVIALDRVEVVHHSGGAPIYFRLSGGAATVKGDGCYMVLPGEAVTVHPTVGGDTTVSVISAAAAIYSVANAT